MSEPTRNVVEPTTNNATERLRALLDEHDEYYQTSGNKTWWGRPIDRQTGKPINVFHCQAQPMGEDRLFVELQLATPEQAIAATLGPGTCEDVTSEGRTQAFTCSECGCWVAYDEYWETGIYVDGDGQAVHIHPRYCPNCGRRVVE